MWYPRKHLGDLQWSPDYAVNNQVSTNHFKRGVFLEQADPAAFDLP